MSVGDGVVSKLLLWVGWGQQRTSVGDGLHLHLSMSVTVLTLNIFGES
jgi:hypothetical protein